MMIVIVEGGSNSTHEAVGILKKIHTHKDHLIPVRKVNET